MPQTAAGLALLIALLNARLAARQGRSGVRWFVTSLLLAPVAWVMTLYLWVGPPPRGGVRVASQAWPWIKLGAMAVAAVILVAAASNALSGLPGGGVTVLP